MTVFFSEVKARVRREASNPNVLEMEEIQRSNGEFSNIVPLFYKTIMLGISFRVFNIFRVY